MKIIRSDFRDDQGHSREEFHKDDEWEEQFHQFTHDLYVGWFHVMPFHEAPEFLRDLSGNGGGEDWMIVTMLDDWRAEQAWIDKISNDIQKILVGEWIIYIGSHA